MSNWITQNWTSGELNALVKKIGEENARAIVSGKVKILVEAINSILTFFRTVETAAQPVITTTEKYFNEAAIFWTSDNFSAQFLGIEVAATQKEALVIRTVTRSSAHKLILAELGEKAEITVSQFRDFLKVNRGNLGWFVFYLKGNDGRLWAVNATWDDKMREWCASAEPVWNLLEVFDGQKVVSRN